MMKMIAKKLTNEAALVIGVGKLSAPPLKQNEAV